MVYKRVRGTIFCRITNIILTKIKKQRKITLTQLKRILCSKFGNNFFRKQNHKYILLNVMEYLLYTKKLSVSVGSTTDEHDSMETEVTVNNSELIIYYNVVTNELLSKFNDAFFSNPSNILAQNICTVYDPFQITLSRNRIQDQIVSDNYFSTRIKGCGNPIGDQKYSGRCWIFACLNVIRVPFMKHYKIPKFEFSQAHMFFWDKIERCNFFLNGIVSTARNGEYLDSRKVMHLLKNPVEDGGYWNMAVNIIKKYGLMPKLSFPESYNSEDSEELNCILNTPRICHCFT
ncbi:bleomycin hydrolase-like [Rhopalosiphum maidis]|uniref:bleomycin hydrolase-like n=1 Tax=Rhopalosiphum maidis TaxID=43146 RepID=UPI000F007DDB|nr:bleomycin hydrolase-like [Rhopalosiphum maidis]